MTLIMLSLGCYFDGGIDFQTAEKFAEDRTLRPNVCGPSGIGDSVTANRKRIGSHIDAWPPTGEVTAPLETGRIEKFLGNERVGRTGFY